MSLILSKGRMSLNDQSFVSIRQRYLYESFNIIQKKYISKQLASVHHNSTSSTLKGLFLRFYGSDPGLRRYDILKHGLQNTDKSRITDSRMHGKSYKSRTEHSRKYGFGSTLRNTDFLIFFFNPDEWISLSQFLTKWSARSRTDVRGAFGK